MNKYLIVLLMLFYGNDLFSQNVIVEIDTFQFFNHTIQISTNEAMKYDMINYDDLAIGHNKYTFDTIQNLLFHESFKNGKSYSRIIHKHKSENYLDVDVIYEDKTIVNYIITTMDEYGLVMMARYFSSDKQRLEGWFSFRIKLYTN